MRPTRFATNTSAAGLLFQYGGAVLFILWLSIFMPMGCGKAQPEGTTNTQTTYMRPKTDEVVIQWYARAASDEGSDWKVIADPPTPNALPPGCVFKVEFCVGTMDEDLKKLEDFRNIDSLQYLELKESNVTDARLVYLKAFRNLRSLNLYSCHRVTDAGMEHLKTLANLEHLDLSGGGCC